MAEAATPKNAKAAAAAEAPPADSAAEATPKKSGRLKLLLMLVAVVVLLAGAGGGFWWWRSSAAAAAIEPAADGGEAPAADAKEEPSGLIPLDPFIVNLPGETSGQLLRATLRIVVVPKEKAKSLSEDEVVRARLRSAVLDILSGQNAQQLLTAEGKTALKRAVMASATKIIHDAKVTDVLLTDFVVQF